MRSAVTGAVVRATVLANQFSSFRTMSGDGSATEENHTRMELGNVDILQLSGGRLVAHGAGWKVFVNRRRLHKPIMQSATTLTGDSPARWFLDVSFQVVDEDVNEVKKYGLSTIKRIAPHGIVGQSFDGSMIAVSGKTDKYTDDAPEFTTTAQVSQPGFSVVHAVARLSMCMSDLSANGSSN